MTKLKLEVDLNDIGYDEDGYRYSFEDIFNTSMKKEITKRVIDNTTAEEIGQYSILVQEHVQDGVLGLFKNLLSEDVTISDGYGRKKFVGSVEDYIKKEIDDKYLHPVDSGGSRLNGCTSSGKTWVQWFIEDGAKKYIDNQIDRKKSDMMKTIDIEIDKIVDTYTDKIIKEKVAKKLLDVGLVL